MSRVLRKVLTGAGTKSWTIPDNEKWEILNGHASVTTSATPGARQMLFRVVNSSSQTVSDAHAGATQAASLTREYNFKAGVYPPTAFINNDIDMPIAKRLICLPGDVITFEDVGNSGSPYDAADTSTVVLTVVISGLGEPV